MQGSSPQTLHTLSERETAMFVAAILSCLAPAMAFAADAHGSHGPSEAIFLCQIIALLVCGRLMGELMQRIGQPAVMGQLIAGILLGPSVLGAVCPQLRHSLFPPSPDQKPMPAPAPQPGILLPPFLPARAPH